MTPDIPSNATITFPAGLPGFESCRRYVLLQSDEFAPGVCLKGLEGAAPTFFLVDPRLVESSVDCHLSSADAARIGAAPHDALRCVWLAIVSPAAGGPHVNVHAPVVINPATMYGMQVLPAEAGCLS
jgi:flagellar assembly factor FliW